MPVPLFIVDAFADRPFSGNPAAVCLLPAPRSAAWMQHVAREMNLSETAFLVPRDGRRLRSSLVHAGGRGRPLRARDARERARALGDGARSTRRARARFHTRAACSRRARRADGLIELDFPAHPARQRPRPTGSPRRSGAPGLLRRAQSARRRARRARRRRPRCARSPPTSPRSRTRRRARRHRHGARSERDLRLRLALLRARASASTRIRHGLRPLLPRALLGARASASAR